MQKSCTADNSCSVMLQIFAGRTSTFPEFGESEGGGGVGNTGAATTPTCRRPSGRPLRALGLAAGTLRSFRTGAFLHEGAFNFDGRCPAAAAPVVPDALATGRARPTGSDPERRSATRGDPGRERSGGFGICEGGGTTWLTILRGVPLRLSGRNASDCMLSGTELPGTELTDTVDASDAWRDGFKLPG